MPTPVAITSDKGKLKRLQNALDVLTPADRVTIQEFDNLLPAQKQGILDIWANTNGAWGSATAAQRDSALRYRTAFLALQVNVLWKKEKDE